MLILMAGLPGTGKSTLARALADRTGGTVLNKDEVRSGLFPPEDIEYSTAQDDFVMRVMLDAAGYQLQDQPERSIFLDGRPFSKKYQVEEVLRAAESMKQRWRILECVCSDETARIRLAADHSHPAANRNYDLYLRTKTSFEEITHAKAVINTEQPIEACVEAGLRALSS